MTFDSFKMNKLDRYHGQSGGVTVRGGSYLTPAYQISSAFRVENPYYAEDGQGFKAKDTGFRVAIVTPIITSNQRLKTLSEDWQRLGKDSNTKDKEIVSDLEKITAGVENKVLQEQLQTLQDALRASNQAKDEQRDQSIRSALQLGAFLCTDVSDLNQNYEQINRIKTYACGAGIENATSEEEKTKAQSTCKTQTNRANEALSVRDFVLNYYSDTLVNTAATYTENSVKTQIEPVLAKLANQNKSNLNKYVDLYWKHLNSYYNNGKVSRDEWLKACSSVNN